MSSLSLLEIHFIRDSEQIPRRLSLLISLRQHSSPHCWSESHRLLSEMDGMEKARPPPGQQLH